MVISSIVILLIGPKTGRCYGVQQVDINRSHLQFAHANTDSGFKVLYIIYIICNKFTRMTSFWIKYRLCYSSLTSCVALSCNTWAKK
jgi:hypothetical protein